MPAGPGICAGPKNDEVGYGQCGWQKMAGNHNSAPLATPAAEPNVTDPSLAEQPITAVWPVPELCASTTPPVPALDTSAVRQRGSALPSTPACACCAAFHPAACVICHGYRLDAVRGIQIVQATAAFPPVLPGMHHQAVQASYGDED